MLDSNTTIVVITNDSVDRKYNKNNTCGECLCYYWNHSSLHCVPIWRRQTLVNDFEIYFVTGAEDICKVGFVAKEHCSEAELLDSKLSGSLMYTPNMMRT